jgi:hypothetical protein
MFRRLANFYREQWRQMFGDLRTAGLLIFLAIGFVVFGVVLIEVWTGVNPVKTVEHLTR